MKENITKDDVIEFLEQQDSDLKMYKRQNNMSDLYYLMRRILHSGFDCKVRLDDICVNYYELIDYKIEKKRLYITYDAHEYPDFGEKTKVLSRDNIFATEEDATKVLDASLDRLKKTVGQIESRLNNEKH